MLKTLYAYFIFKISEVNKGETFLLIPISKPKIKNKLINLTIFILCLK